MPSSLITPHLIEPLSLDEASVDVTQDLRSPRTGSATAQDVRTRIFDETRITTSADISYNKFLAKPASGQRKPNWPARDHPGLGAGFIPSLPGAKFHGTGPVTAAKIQRRLGI
jgi:DNA polymerase-4